MQLKHILVPTDFGDAAAEALVYATALAGKFEARVTLLHVYEIPLYAYSTAMYLTSDVLKGIEAAARARLQEALDEVRKRMPTAATVLSTGAPADTIYATIKDIGADLVVMGTHGRRGLGHMFLGSVAEKTVRRSPVPVLVVHPRPAADV